MQGFIVAVQNQVITLVIADIAGFVKNASKKIEKK